MSPRVAPHVTTPSPKPSDASVTLLNRQTLLKRGSTGLEVGSLQDILRAKGFYKGQTTNKFDAATEEAVRAYQKSTHSKVDGRVGDQTWARLLGREESIEPGWKYMNKTGGYQPQAPKEDEHRIVPESLRLSIIELARQQEKEKAAAEANTSGWKP